VGVVQIFRRAHLSLSKIIPVTIVGQFHQRGQTGRIQLLQARAGGPDAIGLAGQAPPDCPGVEARQDAPPGTIDFQGEGEQYSQDKSQICRLSVKHGQVPHWSARYLAFPVQPFSKTVRMHYDLLLQSRS
jgi:hypothetical protein